MFKLCGIGTFNVHQRLIGFNNSIVYKSVHLLRVRGLSGFIAINMRTHASQITLNAQPFEITATEDNGAKVLVDLLIQGIGAGEMGLDLLRRKWVFSIPIVTDLDCCQCMDAWNDQS
jgi:hypothetical protein